MIPHTEVRPSKTPKMASELRSGWRRIADTRVSGLGVKEIGAVLHDFMSSP
jgi:hypothetical protein